MVSRELYPKVLLPGPHGERVVPKVDPSPTKMASLDFHYISLYLQSYICPTDVSLIPEGYVPAIVRSLAMVEEPGVSTISWLRLVNHYHLRGSRPTSSTFGTSRPGPSGDSPSSPWYHPGGQEVVPHFLVAHPRYLNLYLMASCDLEMPSHWASSVETSELQVPLGIYFRRELLELAQSLGGCLDLGVTALRCVGEQLRELYQVSAVESETPVGADLELRDRRNTEGPGTPGRLTRVDSYTGSWRGTPTGTTTTTTSSTSSGAHPLRATPTRSVGRNSGDLLGKSGHIDLEVALGRLVSDTREEYVCTELFDSSSSDDDCLDFHETPTGTGEISTSRKLGPRGAGIYSSRWQCDDYDLGEENDSWTLMGGSSSTTTTTATTTTTSSTCCGEIPDTCKCDMNITQLGPNWEDIEIEGCRCSFPSAKSVRVPTREQCSKYEKKPNTEDLTASSLEGVPERVPTWE